MFLFDVYAMALMKTVYGIQFSTVKYPSLPHSGLLNRNAPDIPRAQTTGFYGEV